MAATVEQLRRGTDQGRTRDKVPGFDPAAAPLGADEEAAGTPVSPERVAIDRENSVDEGPRNNEDGAKWVYIVIVVVVATVLVGAIYLMH